MTEDTNPGLTRQPRPVYFTAKSLITIVTVVGIIWGAIAGILALMFYPRSDGEKLRYDLDHHVIMEKVQDQKITSLDEADKHHTDVLHRIELRQVKIEERIVPKRHRVPIPEGD